MSMTAISPIPTTFRGVHYRSRLEARWAVFFDALGWPYEYEAEGYELPSGKWYLPDFWMPHFDCWIEVKPAGPDDLFLPAYVLANQSGKRVLVLRGNPWPGEYSIETYGRNELLNGPGWCWGMGEHAESVWVVHGDQGWIGLHQSGGLRDFPQPGHPALSDALLAARSARFEHGESGRTL